MPSHSSPFSPHPLCGTASLVRRIAAGFVLSGAALAQAPENVAIVGTLSPPNGTAGTTGVFYVDLPTPPDPGGAITRLAPLPAQLAVGPFSGIGGVGSVLYRPSDGTLFVGDAAGPNQWNHVHILKVAGPVVVSARSVRVGLLPNVQGLGITVSGLAFLPDGRVAVSSFVGYASGPMATSPLAILDDRPATPTVTPVALDGRFSFPSRHIGGMAVSTDGRTAYLTCANSLPNPAPIRLYAIDLTSSAPVTPVLVHTWQSTWVTRFTTGPDGVIYSTGIDPFAAIPTASIEEIRIANNQATVTSIPASSPAAMMGVALDAATGGFVIPAADFGATTHKNSVLLCDRAGNVKVLAPPPAGGWGMVVAVDLNNAFEPYGAGTSGANRYAFAEFPNPGGLPQVGNAGFSLTVRAAPAAPTTSFVVLATQRDDRPLLGIRLLVDLGRPHVLVPLPAALSAVLPLPIPNDASLRGTTFFAQSAHADAGSALATSNGVAVYIK